MLYIMKKVKNQHKMFPKRKKYLLTQLYVQ